MHYSSLLHCEKMSFQSQSAAVGTPGRVPERAWKRVPFDANHCKRNTRRNVINQFNDDITCIGMFPSAGYRTQLRHIFMTMSSRNTTISCVQYCMRHGLLVNTADGSAEHTSSVTQFGMAGLQHTPMTGSTQ